MPDCCLAIGDKRGVKRRVRAITLPPAGAVADERSGDEPRPREEAVLAADEQVGAPGLDAFGGRCNVELAPGRRWLGWLRDRTAPRGWRHQAVANLIVPSVRSAW